MLEWSRMTRNGLDGMLDLLLCIVVVWFTLGHKVRIMNLESSSGLVPVLVDPGTLQTLTVHYDTGMIPAFSGL